MRARIAVWVLQAAALLLPCLVLQAAPALAQDAAEQDAGIEDLTVFKSLPILNNGRKMPIDTYARLTLLSQSGRTRVGDLDAAAWLAKTLFKPSVAVEDKVFLADHPETVQALGVDADNRGRYSLAELKPGLMKLHEAATKAMRIEEKERSLVESELIRLYGNVLRYMDLADAFSFSVPVSNLEVQDAELRELLGVEEGEASSFMAFMSKARLLQPIISELPSKPQEEWSHKEQEAFRLSRLLYETGRRHRSGELTIMPMNPHGEEHWLVPWAVISLGVQDQGSMNAVQNLNRAAVAYRAGDQAAFDKALSDYRLYVESRNPGDVELARMPQELQLNSLKPFFWAKFLYFIGLLAACWLLMVPRNRALRWAVVLLILAALVPHTAGIGLRMWVMGRPPVTNLYATFLFVAWITALLGCIMELIQKNGLGALLATLGGLVLMMIAARFGMEGDSLGKVVAVLDSNFWLTTHVLAITTGYAGCVAAGLIGHAYLVAAIVKPGAETRLQGIDRALYAVLGFGLIFSFLGTMLGGVWADQSWGRFWGWDPKENGALLIVLWCSILYHARLARMIGPIGFAAGNALGIIIVMMAWLGVNLLGVGLHSYGFTSGLARGLLTYIAVQTVVAFGLAMAAKVRQKG